LEADMSTAITVDSFGRSGNARRRTTRALWLVLALFWTAFAILEGLNHGLAGWAGVLIGLVVPVLSMFIGAGRSAGLEQGRIAPNAVPLYNTLHRMVVPLAISVLYAIGPWHLPALFAALCGWMAHIAWQRVFGFGLRNRDGWRRG
jgi:hypothetical protein